jgi:hypothetical protein
MSALLSRLAAWRAEPTEPVAMFGLGIVRHDGALSWKLGDEREPLSEFDLRFIVEDDLRDDTLPRVEPIERTSREYLLAMAAWGVGPVLRHVRMKCHECMGGDRGGMPSRGTARAIEECFAAACPLWPFRLGFDPRRRELTPEEAQAKASRMRRPDHDSFPMAGHQSAPERAGAPQPGDGAGPAVEAEERS